MEDALSIVAGLVFSGRWPSLAEYEKNSTAPKGVDGLGAMIAGL